jgi:hypothetical protein
VVRTFLKVAFSCFLVIIAVALRLDQDAPFKPIPSPDGALLLKPYLDDEGLVAYCVANRTGETIAKVETRASNHSRWVMGWNSNDTVVLDSSDIGTYAWRIGDHNEVKELTGPISKRILFRDEN